MQRGWAEGTLALDMLLLCLVLCPERPCLCCQMQVEQSPGVQQVPWPA